MQSNNMATSHITPGNNIASSQDEWSSAALHVLYSVTSGITATRTAADLYKSFIDALSRELDTKALAIRILTDEGWMELVESKGLPEDYLEKNSRVPIDGSLFNIAHQGIAIIRKSDADNHFSNASTVMFTIPISHHGHALGVYHAFMGSPYSITGDELDNLFMTLGQNLGACIDKIHLEQDERKRLIVDERNIIANELHDSLAQTLASLRFQVRVLDETLQPTSEYGAILGIERVENSLDEAYTDLRALIAHCRAPIEQQGLVPSIEALANRFRKETRIHLLLQSENNIPDLPVNLEIQVYRIVQEALTNIRKHANAHIVRVLLNYNENGEYHVLIEDDGTGFIVQPESNKPGEQIGLTIMKERARHLGGQLRIESDSDEGTRVELVFSYRQQEGQSTADLSGANP